MAFEIQISTLRKALKNSMNNNQRYKKEDLELLNKILSKSMKQNIIDQLRGTDRKLKVIDNCSGELKNYPIGYTIEIYSPNDELIMQTFQQLNP